MSYNTEFNFNGCETDLLIYAVRYTLGRQSYSAPTVCEFIKNNIDVFDRNTIANLIKDITEYLERQFDGFELHIATDGLTKKVKVKSYFHNDYGWIRVLELLYTKTDEGLEEWMAQVGLVKLIFDFEQESDIINISNNKE